MSDECQWRSIQECLFLHFGSNKQKTLATQASDAIHSYNQDLLRGKISSQGEHDGPCLLWKSGSQVINPLVAEGVGSNLFCQDWLNWQQINKLQSDALQQVRSSCARERLHLDFS